MLVDLTLSAGYPGNFYVLAVNLPGWPEVLSKKIKSALQSARKGKLMQKFTGYRCSLCGTEYLPGQVTYTCPKDGGNLDIILDYDGLKKKYQPEDITSRTDPSLWRYLPLLPVMAKGREPQPDRFLQGPRQRSSGRSGARDQSRSGRDCFDWQRRSGPGRHGGRCPAEGGYLCTQVGAAGQGSATTGLWSQGHVGGWYLRRCL